MKEKFLIFVIAVLILAISFFWIPNQNLTGFATSEVTTNLLSIQLDTTKFATSSPLTGTITLVLSEDLDPNELITFSLNNKKYSYSIENLLKKSNFTLDYSTTEFNAINEESTKTISFSEAGSKFIGLKMPRYSEVDSISYKLLATKNKDKYPQAVSMDFGNEGTIDWYFLGTFQSYNSTLIHSEDLDGSSEGTGYVQSGSYYCEFLNLPRTKDITILANYTKTGSDGDLQAVILSVPSENPKVGWEGGSDTCDLPESGATKSCSINLDYTIEGKYLICIFDDKESSNTNLYEIPLDNSAETSTAFTCPTSTNSVCKETGFNNFFIYTETGKYNNTLSGSISVNTWETFTNAILTGLKYYVGSSPYNGLCKTSSCTIPINITSESAGNITFSSLSIIYDYNYIVQGTNTWFDLEMSNTKITAINTQILEDGTTIEIPLSIINLTEETIGSYILETNFLNTTTENTITFLSPEDIVSVSTKISTATDRLNSFLNENSEEYKIFVMLNQKEKIKTALDELNTLKTKIGFTEDALIVEEAESILNDLPWTITITETKSEILDISSSDIPTILSDTINIETMQETINVKGSLNTIVINTYSEEESLYILIIETITANEDISDATIYQTFPISFNNFLYIERPTTSSGSQAEFTFDLNNGKSKKYYYLSTEAVSLSDFKSIIVTPVQETIKEPIYECGDNICISGYETETSCPEDCMSSFNYFYIIIPLVIIISGILLFIFRKRILKLKQLSTNKNPLVTFFQKGIAKKISKDQLINTLRKKGWKEEDIQNAVKQSKF